MTHGDVQERCFVAGVARVAGVAVCPALPCHYGGAGGTITQRGSTNTSTEFSKRYSHAL